MPELATCTNESEKLLPDDLEKLPVRVLPFFFAKTALHDFG
jgi:hypothetical protein